MKKLIGILLITLYACSPKYEVIQQLAPDKYHLQGVKGQDVIIVITSSKLKEGQLVTLKSLKQSNGYIE